MRFAIWLSFLSLAGPVALADLPTTQPLPATQPVLSLTDAVAALNQARADCISRLKGDAVYRDALAAEVQAETDKANASGSDLPAAAVRLLAAKTALRKIESSAIFADIRVIEAEKAVQASQLAPKDTAPAAQSTDGVLRSFEEIIAQIPVDAQPTLKYGWDDLTIGKASDYCNSNLVGREVKLTVTIRIAAQITRNARFPSDSPEAWSVMVEPDIGKILTIHGVRTLMQIGGSMESSGGEVLATKARDWKAGTKITVSGTIESIQIEARTYNSPGSSGLAKLRASNGGVEQGRIMILLKDTTLN